MLQVLGQFLPGAGEEGEKQTNHAGRSISKILEISCLESHQVFLGWTLVTSHHGKLYLSQVKRAENSTLTFHHHWLEKSQNVKSGGLRH